MSFWKPWPSISLRRPGSAGPDQRAGPEGGLFLWVSLPPHIDTDELFFEAIEHKVAFVPGEQFYGENPEHNHMRINFSFVSKEQLAIAVGRLADCIKKRL